MTLEQSLEPNFRPPKPFDGLIKGDLSFRINLAYYLKCIHGCQNYRAGKKRLHEYCCRHCSTSTEDHTGTAERRGAEDQVRYDCCSFNLSWNSDCAFILY